MAGMIAKYFATSFAMLKVVKAPFAKVRYRVAPLTRLRRLLAR